MKKDTLINVITNEIDEIKKICHDIDNNELEDYLVELAIDKTNTLRKELYLLQKAIKHPTFAKSDNNNPISLKLDKTICEEKTANISSDSENIISPLDNEKESLTKITIDVDKNSPKKEEKQQEENLYIENVELENKKNTPQIKDVNSQININKTQKDINNNKDIVIPNIGINDKFLFIRELFNGDNNDYKSTINNIIDNSISRKDICNNRKWNLEDETVDLFFKLLNIE